MEWIFVLAIIAYLVYLIYQTNEKLIKEKKARSGVQDELNKYKREFQKLKEDILSTQTKQSDIRTPSNKPLIRQNPSPTLAQKGKNWKK